MKVTFSDAETTYVVRNDKLVPLPYIPENKIVSLGWCDNTSPVEYRFVHHTDPSAITVDPAQTKVDFQKVLDETQLFVAHNVKFDLGWYKAVGWKYDGKVWDTQVAEYVISRGRKWPLNLKACCERNETEHKKLEVVEKYFDDQVPTDEIPHSTLLEYGIGDHLCLRDLYHKQRAYLALPENSGLLPTIEMMNEFIYVLIDMEKNGLCIDREALASIKVEFQKEKKALDEKIFQMAAAVMGDKPYNINSPEQLSQIIYSRKVNSKETWGNIFNIGTELRGAVFKQKYKPRMSAEEFKAHVRQHTTFVKREKAEQCPDCSGRGKRNQVLSGARLGKRLVKCKACQGSGIGYSDTGRVAGFKLSPLEASFATAGGFATDHETLEQLTAASAEEGKDSPAGDFIRAVVRANALETYLNSYVGGIEKYVLSDNILHPGINQCITATGRLSSSNPNFQNLPRANTFPLKRAIVSRFSGGSIVAADYAGLEYRAACFLAQDKVGINDIKNKVDPHGFTRDTLQAAGELLGLSPKEARQQAKPSTFKPLYGGVTGTEAQKAYFKAFMVKHAGIAAWQQALQDTAVSVKKITLPTGREYAFPDATRTKWGGSTSATQIKNYPVQGFATGDLVPLGILLAWREMQKAQLKSLMILDVHDEALVDCYPGEEDAVTECLSTGMLGVVEELVTRYGIYFNVPLGIELKKGRSWLEAKEFLTREHSGVSRPQ